MMTLTLFLLSHFSSFALADFEASDSRGPGSTEGEEERRDVFVWVDGIFQKIDERAQHLRDCREDDDDALDKVKDQCGSRGLALCSMEAYLMAYGVLQPPNMYAYTSSTEGCGPGRHWGED